MQLDRSTVIHRLNFRNWLAIIEAGAAMGLDQLSFLPADVSSEAFNRANPWDEPRQHEILLTREELPELKEIIRLILRDHAVHFATGFIAEPPAKLSKIGEYYSAHYGLNPFPYKKCNAPLWNIRRCSRGGRNGAALFFSCFPGKYPWRGNACRICLNGEKATYIFQRNLDMDTNDTCAGYTTCVKCVCYLNLPPRA